MRFLVDAQLPPGLAERLGRAGHDAVHVTQVLEAAATDLAVLAETNARKAVLITKDGDFVVYSIRGLVTVGVLWIRIGNTTNRELWKRLEPLLPAIVEAFESGENLVEVA